MASDVTVVIPGHNAEAFIANCLDGVLVPTPHEADKGLPTHVAAFSSSMKIFQRNLNVPNELRRHAHLHRARNL
jgi:hypothetical protein